VRESGRRRGRGESWYDGDTINYGIGQGFLLVTVLQVEYVDGDIPLQKKRNFLF
jgi:hypothetical protein